MKQIHQRDNFTYMCHHSVIIYYHGITYIFNGQKKLSLYYYSLIYLYIKQLFTHFFNMFIHSVKRDSYFFKKTLFMNCFYVIFSINSYFIEIFFSDTKIEDFQNKVLPIVIERTTIQL